MTLNRIKAITVAHSRGIICGKWIDYRLIKGVENKPIYRIRINFRGEIAERSVSGSIFEAAKLYDIIVKNHVTPCTFDDVIEDYFANF